MPYNHDIHHRRSIRLREYDYRSAGAYFVTVCAFQRELLFGEVIDGEIRLNDAGRCVEEWWRQVATHFSGVDIDQYIIMPNHFHGIVTIVGAGSPRPDACATGNTGVTPENMGVTPENTGENMGGETPPLRCPTLGQIVGYFKFQSTKHVNIVRNDPGCPVWQRNYYEHVIRNDTDLTNIRQYVVNNPLKWDLDENNPENAGNNKT